jgi:hypothetical protein
MGDFDAEKAARDFRAKSCGHYRTAEGAHAVDCIDCTADALTAAEAAGYRRGLETAASECFMRAENFTVGHRLATIELVRVANRFRQLAAKEGDG